MKKMLLFAMTLLSVNSAFAMNDILQCTNGKTVVNTAYFLNQENLFLTVHYLVADARPLQANVTASRKFWKPKTFKGETSDGTSILLKVDRNDLTGTLYVEGREPETLVCKEQVFFPL
ncbi:hypothetical protein [Bdellovibrio sp. HCB2-146]|uniref:hypothetical protein n=1 Tax=Bdellovibrio sp. HCB2-146 TaxID=3394362 RepID=UPI0039BD6C3D